MLIESHPAEFLTRITSQNREAVLIQQTKPPNLKIDQNYIQRLKLEWYSTENTGTIVTSIR